MCVAGASLLHPHKVADCRLGYPPSRVADARKEAAIRGPWQNGHWIGGSSHIDRERRGDMHFEDAKGAAA